jgi:hypothetical protein
LKLHAAALEADCCEGQEEGGWANALTSHSGLCLRRSAAAPSSRGTEFELQESGLKYDLMLAWLLQPSASEESDDRAGATEGAGRCAVRAAAAACCRRASAAARLASIRFRISGGSCLVDAQLAGCGACEDCGGTGRGCGCAVFF